MAADDRDLVAILFREVVRRAYPEIATTPDTIKERLAEVLDESGMRVFLEGSESDRGRAAG